MEYFSQSNLTKLVTKLEFNKSLNLKILFNVILLHTIFTILNFERKSLKEYLAFVPLKLYKVK